VHHFHSCAGSARTWVAVRWPPIILSILRSNFVFFPSPWVDGRLAVDALWSPNGPTRRHGFAFAGQWRPPVGATRFGRPRQRSSTLNYRVAEHLYRRVFPLSFFFFFFFFFFPLVQARRRNPAPAVRALRMRVSPRAVGRHSGILRTTDGRGFCSPENTQRVVLV